jgi:putative oxidoreductase
MSAYAGIALRAVVGAIYLFQAYLALFASTPKGLAAYIEKLGFQVHTILAVSVIAINGIGGAMLIIGLWTRLAGSLNAAVLLLGLLTVYVRQNVLLKGTLVDAAIGRAGAGYEYVALLAAATVLVAVGGGGGGSGGKK